MKTRTAALAAVALAATMTLSPTVAGAQVRAGDGARVDRVKARCLSAIDRRQQAIVELNDRIANRPNLSEDHRSALKQIDDATSSGLTSLANTIQGEDNAAELRAECRQIVVDYRVFVLVRPRARLVMVSDRELAAVAKLRDAADRIQAAIDKAKADGKDTGNAETDLATMRSAIDTAATHAGAVYEEVIHITPQQFADGVLTPGRDDARAARDSIRAAAQAGHHAVRDLKGSSSAT